MLDNQSIDEGSLTDDMICNISSAYIDIALTLIDSPLNIILYQV